MYVVVEPTIEVGTWEELLMLDDDEEEVEELSIFAVLGDAEVLGAEIVRGAEGVLGVAVVLEDMEVFGGLALVVLAPDPGTCIDWPIRRRSQFTLGLSVERFANVVPTLVAMPYPVSPLTTR